MRTHLVVEKHREKWEILETAIVRNSPLFGLLISGL
jgi:hypothetical protein